jgi:DNA-binding LacI/PurR family transcriptional regulator
VILDAAGTAGSMPSVDLDVSKAVSDLSDHLASLGHSRVAYIGVTRDKKASLEHRREELQVGLLRHGSGLAVDDLMLAGLTIDHAFRGFVRI